MNDLPSDRSLWSHVIRTRKAPQHEGLAGAPCEAVRDAPLPCPENAVTALPFPDRWSIKPVVAVGARGYGDVAERLKAAVC